MELQLRFLERATEFDALHGFAEYVPDSAHILSLWADTLTRLHAGDFAGLRGRLDWVMKRAVLEQALDENPGWSWDARELTYLDQVYSSLDPADSLFLSLEAEGLIEPLATEAEISRFVIEPPADTRAWTRAMVLRAADERSVNSVDWDRIELDIGRFSARRICIPLPDPLGATESQTAPAFSQAEDLATVLSELPGAGIDVRVERSYALDTAVSLLDHYGIHQYTHPEEEDQ